MIRFFDKEVNCVTSGELTRDRLFSYFLDGNREDILCVIDEDGRYQGNITYVSLLHSTDVQGSIRTEKVVLDEHLWENGRKFFNSYQNLMEEVILLPVVDQEGQLICFACQDMDANRELRQLRELQAYRNALSFRDVFPEFDCVTIWECNELAYYFAQYLKEIGVPVSVKGSLWKYFGEWEGCETLDYRNLNIYADGTWEKSNNLRENLLRSVSAEFECIDQVYEKNIQEGWITDQAQTSENLLLWLQKQPELYLIGTGPQTQDTYDFLLEHGADIAGFVSKELDQPRQMLLGKQVCSWYEIQHSTQAVLIECTQKHSAWGAGYVDFFDYAGYYRNERCILMRDYFEVSKRSLLKHALHGRRIVLTGDSALCGRLLTYLKDQADCYYWNYQNAADEWSGCSVLSGEDITEEDICIPVFPEYFAPDDHSAGIRKKEECLKGIKESGVLNLTDYFCDTVSLIQLEHELTDREWKEHPKGIIIGAISYCCGNMFFRGVLEGHSQILMMDSGFLSDNLFSICLRLSAEKSENIAAVFWKIMEEEAEFLPAGIENLFPSREKFHKTLERELAKKDSFCSQELFTIFHLAYASMWGEAPADMTDMVIYWEPHLVPRDVCEQYAAWLYHEKVSGYIVNVVRNGTIRAGSYLNFYEHENRLTNLEIAAYWHMVDEAEPRRESYDGFQRVIVKFEDIKCKPEETLESLCQTIGISWSDTFLQTTSHGVQTSYHGTTGYDIRPVYDTYERYFSGYDRMRLVLLLSEWQAEYEYPCVDILEFSRRELQEMFVKDFRFEDMYQFHEETDRLRYKMQKMNWMHRQIQRLIFMRSTGRLILK